MVLHINEKLLDGSAIGIGTIKGILKHVHQKTLVEGAPIHFTGHLDQTDSGTQMASTASEAAGLQTASKKYRSSLSLRRSRHYETRTLWQISNTVGLTLYLRLSFI